MTITSTSLLAAQSQTTQGYYQLKASASSSTSAADSAQTTAATNNAAIQASFLLSLSPEAQSYLSGAGLLSSSSDSSSSGTTATTASNFILTAAQQTTFNSIIAKYKGQPYTQDVFNEIQTDLQNAGLSPDQLAQSAQIKSFNPTSTLLSSLFGTSSDSTSTSSTADYTSAKNNYVQQISDAFSNVAAATTSA